MQIQALEEKTGLDRATIRYYEQEGLISPARLPNGYRDYSEKQLLDLQKIKLLRQLGLSIETISQLMNGTDNLNAVLESQVIVLRDHKTQIDRAEEICQMILQDNVTYETILPGKYFSVSGSNKKTPAKVSIEPNTESVYKEAHPARRFLGRYLDQLLTAALLMLIFIVVLRVRPLSKTLNTLLSIASILLSMPLNALFLRLFGTTAGKFAMGIFLKSPDGKNMSYRDALSREWDVFRYGMGYNLPVYNIVRLIKSYNVHLDGRELEWDYNTDVYYKQWDTKRSFTSVVLCAVVVISIVFSSISAIMPEYRCEDLTLKQYTENYNNYAKLYEMHERLSEEGEWYTPGYTPTEIKTYVSDENGMLIDAYNSTDFWYFETNENQELTKITIDNHRLYAGTNLAGGKVDLAIYTAILSQPGSKIMDASAASQILSEIVFTKDRDESFNINGVLINIKCTKRTETTYRVIVDIVMP